ncbi:magnesium transporter CorA family protein [Bifidobacterium sp. ESL0790]|uniref:magnesium transporter CorA family protein n=1 Tax=Bifidobacterium sp. ESL0790 TaxID=2983233 RepID=UPI0023F6EF00|nr:magnesium transporter CorA family protein [Bifidobacterium sp. ESL0790]WEV71772.1 magnesium transporter CorA family protein [Bifidobacterium sp. ESL0790]
MLRMFNTINGQVEQINKPEDGSWLCLSDPTDVELTTVAQETGVDLADLRAPLDDEERSRVDAEDDYTMIIVDIPTVEQRDGRDHYETIPLSIVVTDTAIITVCMRDTPVLHPFMEGTIRGFNTYMKSRFVLQILYRNATMYLRYLRIIDRNSDNLELKLQHSMQNREILMLLELSKTLVYFTTSLKSNEIVMEKLRVTEKLNSLTHLKQYPEDEDLLDDVITENKQAIEMANIYSGVLANMTDASASIVSNNLNNVMRIFTIISIIISIPTLIFSMYGMNFQTGMLGMPFTASKWGFVIVIVISLVITALATWWLTRSKLFK